MTHFSYRDNRISVYVSPIASSLYHMYSSQDNYIHFDIFPTFSFCYVVCNMVCNVKSYDKSHYREIVNFVDSKL